MRVFLDSSTIIFGLEFKESNSAIVLDLLFDKRFEGFTSEKVLEEVRRYFSRRRGKNYAYLVVKMLKNNLKIILRSEIKESIRKWKGKIKEKDLEHLAVVKGQGIEILVAYDQDFQPFGEYMTPKQFVESMGLTPFETDF